MTWDCHAHVFGPYEKFPLAKERTYDPPAAPFEMHEEFLQENKIGNRVLVQPSAYAQDHSCLVDALRRGQGKLRGVGVLGNDSKDSEFQDLHDAGVRAIRFMDGNYIGAVGLEQFDALAPRIKALGWHAEMWIPLERVMAEAPRLLRAGIPLVLDHMGRFDVAAGVKGEAFQKMLGYLKDGAIWIKLCPARNSKQFPDYEDVRPFHDAMVAANPARLVWGSDWPYLRMGERTPRASHLLALLKRWVGDEGLLRRILEENPPLLYG